jgi:betaine-homocysteine S-methyltransferase
VVEAFTYYGHRAKLRLIGKEDLLEPLNRQALAIAKDVADETGALFAGDISNTNIFFPDDEARREVRAMFDEQVAWAVDAGVDYVIGETFSWAEEALLALEAIKGTGLPAVITLAMHQDPVTRDGVLPEEACKRLEEAGAAVVGLNCIRGPRTMMPMLKAVREACSGHVAALPVPYRTTEAEPTFQSLRDPIAEFGKKAYSLGIRYLGVCCGAGPHHIRSLAEALGRTPPASRYSPDMSKHAFFGSHEQVPEEYRDYASRL